MHVKWPAAIKMLFSFEVSLMLLQMCSFDNMYLYY